MLMAMRIAWHRRNALIILSLELIMNQASIKGPGVIILLLLIGISTRFLFLGETQSFLPNFTAVGAVALFGSNYLRGKTKYILPLFIMWVSDLFLNNIFYASYFESFQFFGDIWVYAGFLVVVLIGHFIMRKPSWFSLMGAGIGGGIIFYLITNFGVWIHPASGYPKDIGGLVLSYVNGIPFLRNTILGNLVYGITLFGIYEFLASKYHSLRTERCLVSRLSSM